ncbi:uncharacterized protein TEOVI_000599700 [Trypanosoma equiperdum]|uniref:Uncharacterized protein n=3 Tax=Trypanozoon TaxID=39700 RepID=Q38F24_TRYB2|nr:hypothetical protein, unlikely [Trypanosoma brucei brucei TREU927]EAN76596.1 hypothetical protein, unlikely [Trypanosoma brucei brucei TREU927]RHW70527.1 hypothetical protein DPX39_090023700 [Trypanosoma brucei equiperdum]SCU67944.1 hypothetical protein, conserved [Trypanosoma equiperdum]
MYLKPPCLPLHSVAAHAAAAALIFRRTFLFTSLIVIFIPCKSKYVGPKGKPLFAICTICVPCHRRKLGCGRLSVLRRGLWSSLSNRPATAMVCQLKPTRAERVKKLREGVAEECKSTYQP